jgi:hypothetical protein
MVVRLAGDAGFTLAEIRQLVTEFGRNRWRRLAQRKLGEVRAASERLRSMTVLLEKLLDCKCPDIEFCGRAIEKSAQRPRRTRRGAKTRSPRWSDKIVISKETGTNIDSATPSSAGSKLTRVRGISPDPYRSV